MYLFRKSQDQEENNIMAPPHLEMDPMTADNDHQHHVCGDQHHCHQCSGLYHRGEDSSPPQVRKIDVPEDCGIMVELKEVLDPKTGRQTCQVILHTAVPNQNYEQIHPHCHGPANMKDVRLLHGGGSGTAVFHGESTRLGGSIVMKHGGPKDAKEVFSLVTIRQELSRRSILQEQIIKDEAQAAAARMRQKIPEFVMVYISPYHLRDRYQELWASLRLKILDSPNERRESFFRRVLSSFEMSKEEEEHQQNLQKKKTERIHQEPSYSDFTITSVENQSNTSHHHHQQQQQQQQHSATAGEEEEEDGKYPNKPERVRPRSQTIAISHAMASPRKQRSVRGVSRRMSQTDSVSIQRKEKEMKRRIRVILGEQPPHPNSEHWNIGHGKVDIIVNANAQFYGNRHSYVLTDGLDALQNFSRAVRHEMADHNWKVTLGQKKIGGDNAENGAHALTSGKLRRKFSSDKHYRYDDLLQKLVNEFTQVMEDLSMLTYSHERRGERFTKILHEIGKLKQEHSNHAMNGTEEGNMAVLTISKNVDLYVGSAIRKNFEPRTGRFAKLREFASNLRCDDMLWQKEGFSSSTDSSSDEEISQSWAFLESCSSNEWIFTRQEETPARFLAMLLDKEDRSSTNSMSRHSLFRSGIANVFVDPPAPRSALDEMEERGWLDLLEHATSFLYDEGLSHEAVSAAMDCIWTCGLTDAGLHNTFVHQERGLELFDLGAPRLEPQPAFLTKFLMSFFHTLGMEEDEKDEFGNWVQRFTVVEVDDKQMLKLTDKTKEMIPDICDAFNVALDHFIKNTFYGNEHVRSLLLKYVVLQLLSDSSFCLSRWEEKGGGTERYGDKLQDPLEKWLWRSLWDQYIAAYVYAKLLKPCEDGCRDEFQFF